MLVLSRKPGQRIHIGSDIIITVVDISGKYVRLGINAPETVCILRSEILEQIERENKLAAISSNNMEPLKKLQSLFRDINWH